MKRCMYCGHENEDTNVNCVKCGNRLLDTPSEQNGASADAGQDAVKDVLNDAAPDNVADAVDDNLGYGDPYGQYGGYPQYGGQDYAYPGSENAQQQYGGQAYGYEDDPQQYGQDYYHGRGRGNSAAVLMKKARKRMHNPFLFLGILFYTIHLVASVLNYVLGNAMVNVSTVTHFITSRLKDQKEIVNLINTGVQSLDKVNKLYLLGGCLVSLLPVLLFVLGLWIAFFKTTNRQEQNSTGGLTLCRVSIVFKLIGVCAAFLAAIAFLVVFVVSAGAASHMMSLIGGIIVLLVLVLAAVLVLLYYVQVMYGIKVVRANVRDGSDIGKIPGFAILVGFIGCAATVLSMIPMAPDDYIGLAAKGAYAAWLLLSSFWALIYRATVRSKQ